MRKALVLVIALLFTVVGTAQETATELEARVTQVVASLDGAERVTVSVENNVVTLDGLVLDAERIEEIEAAVSRVDGVLAVNNQIRLDFAVTSRIDPMRERLVELGHTTLALIPLLGIAFAILLVFWLLAGVVARSESLLRHFARTRPVRELVARTASTLVFLVGVVLALDIVGATAIVGGVLGAAGLVGIAVGFAFKDLIENYIASVMLSVRQPFAPDDHVVIDDFEGIVVRLTTRSTLLLTFDGNSLRLPNAMVFKSVIKNYSATPERRFDFSVGVGYGEDLEAVQALGLKTLASVDGVLADPGPISRVSDLDASSVALTFFGWVSQRTHVLGKVRSDAVTAIEKTFREHGISMPEPIHRVIMEQPEASGPESPKPMPVPRRSDAAAEQRAEGQQVEFLRRKAEEGRDAEVTNLIDTEAPPE